VLADIAKLSVGREAYYTRELATDHEQYLSGHGESPGRWYGAGATSLGLEGEASPADFRQMFEGGRPRQRRTSWPPAWPQRRPRLRVVLRPTKSVSILNGLAARPPAVRRSGGIMPGLAEAVAYLDEHLGARRGHGGVQHVSGQGVLAVGFDHRTSREGDPLLHTHLIIANRVQGPDGRWTALDGRDLYRHRLAADAIVCSSPCRRGPTCGPILMPRNIPSLDHFCRPQSAPTCRVQHITFRRHTSTGEQFLPMGPPLSVLYCLLERSGSRVTTVTPVAAASELVILSSLFTPRGNSGLPLPRTTGWMNR
jgi:hypothetical protein